MEDNATPGSDQDTSEKLFFGKYKTIEEAQAAMQELQRKNTDLEGQLNAERSVNRLFEETRSTESRNSGYEPADLPPAVDEETAKYFQKREADIINRAVTTAVTQVGEILSAREVVDKFYRDNTDLDNYRDIVRTEYDRMKSDRGGKITNTPEVMNEIARRARQRVNEIQTKSKNPPPHLETGNSQNRSRSVEKKESPEPDDEENLRTFMDDHRKQGEKRSNLRG